MPPKGRIVVDDRYCKGCEICVSECPQDVLELARGPDDPKRVSSGAIERDRLYRLRNLRHCLP